jgi:Activator of mitotic machinery Cdc14 phosphatase activation C-term
MRPPANRNNSWERQNGATSPEGMRNRSASDTATTQFPLNDIDYESSPAAVAQELSNLQALRRMSMDVAAAGDPDLPSLNAAAMPAAPSASDSEDDSSRLFWVPARLHPELAPKEFKSFLESKADQIKRRSGELSSFASTNSSRSGSLSSQGGVQSGGGLQRKKSMLSRQIDNSNGRGAEGYQDGAERLERKRSMSARRQPQDPNLEELESLVTEPTRLQRLSLESGEAPGEDVILPSVPGQSLRRSTRTQYRRGSNKGQPNRMSYARRTGRANAPGEDEPSEDVPSVPAVPTIPDVPPVPPISTEQIFGPPSRANTEPVSTPARTTNFSRPGRSPPSSISTTPDSVRTFDTALSHGEPGEKSSAPPQGPPRQWQSRLSTHGRSSLQVPPENQTIPQIVLEAPKSPEEEQPQIRPSSSPAPSTSTSIQNRLPERKSSREETRPISPPSQRPPLNKQSSPLNNNRGMPPSSRNGQSLEQMSSHPSPLPGNDTNTGNLSFIPTYASDQRADDKKLKDVKKDDGRKSSWGWLLGKEETENKDKRLESLHTKPKAKINKPPEKHDNTRLDVLQNSIEGGKGRESLVLDRNNLKLEEERKKESARKTSGGESKKEKDGLFSSIFGGGKKHKADRDAGSKKHLSRGLSPDPPHKILKPDVDYNWTRFSILEERAIYRMAHIKLANPRRALYSQVLLSNFMYSYLAKVQQMHPQMNLPTSAKQQKKQQQQTKDQPDEFTQYQRYQMVCLLKILVNFPY